MIAPPRRGFHVIAHINLALDVQAQSEKGSGLWISWLPTFSSKWLIRRVILSGLLDCWGGVGWVVRPSMEPISPSPTVADYFRQPFSASLNNKRKNPVCFFSMLCSNIHLFHHQFLSQSYFKMSPLWRFLLSVPTKKGMGPQECEGTFHQKQDFFFTLQRVSMTHHLPVREV